MTAFQRAKAYKILIADLIGLKFDSEGQPDPSQVQDYIEDRGGIFYRSGIEADQEYTKGNLHFFYLPDLSKEQEILEHTSSGQYDALITAATVIPALAQFDFGGVRIGSGTGNMGSASWGGGNGVGGIAPLMNTPSLNSCATAQMAMKALLEVCPNLPVHQMHERVVAGQFDTGIHLRDYPTEKLSSKRIAILGFGNIGQEMAKLTRAFGMTIVIYARSSHKKWIESQGYIFAATPQQAAADADVISIHTGLGSFDRNKKTFANQGMVDATVLNAMKSGAIVINYDRGEIINTDALDQALGNGQISHVAIDADLFIVNESDDKQDRQLSGPMLPYREMETRHQGKLSLLPHAAADTEHWSRVEGAIQAVDQLYEVIGQASVINLVGDLPDGYNQGGKKTATGVGKISDSNILALTRDPKQLKQLALMSKEMYKFWTSLAAQSDEQQGQALIKGNTEQQILNINSYLTQLETLGLRCPYESQEL
ncbi:MAG: hypothetical protein GY829_00875 [Gammaproteobacteria bacterium]|nr:hypothetical protein [Gammaproteobacteria bacterium]